MMDKLRTVASHTAFKIIFAIIMLSFVFAGVGGIFSASSNNKQIATVNGNPVDERSYLVTLKNTKSVLTQQESETSEQFAERAKYEALNAEISDIVFLDKILKEGVTISDPDVIAEIRKETVFHVNGQFNNERYLQILKENGYTPDSYAENFRQYLSREYASAAIFQTNFALPEDSKVTELEDQTRSIYTSLIPVKKLLEDAPKYTDEQIKQYYDEHLTRFKTGGRVIAEAVGISTSDVEKTIQVTDKDINNYYKSHKADFTSPERKKFSVIRVKTTDEATDILAQLKKGADFVAIAKEKSIFPSLRQNGGDLGWFNVDENLPEELQNLMLTKKGQLSDVIELSGNFAIFRLDDVTKSKLRSLKEAHDDIKTIVTEEKITKQFEKLAKEAEQLAEQHPDTLEPVAKLLNTKVNTSSQWIERENGGFKFYSMPQLNDELSVLFNNYSGQGVNSPLVYFNTGDGRFEHFYILRIAQYIPEGIIPFDIAKSQAEQFMRADWVRSIIETKAKEMVTEAKAGNSDILVKNGVQFAQVLTLDRHSPNVNKGLLDKVFSTSLPVNGEAVYDYYYLPPENAWIYMLIDFQNGKEPRDISDQIRNVYIANDLEAFLSSLREDAKIKVNKPMLDALSSNVK